MAKQNKSKKQPTRRAKLWWTRLSLQEQMEYLEKHPRSKLKPSIKKTAKLPKDVEQAIDKHTPDIVADLEQAIDKAEKAWPDVVAAMDPKEVKAIEAELQDELNQKPPAKKKRAAPKGKLLDVITGEDEEDWGVNRTRRITRGIMLATKIGLLTVGAGALLAVNPNYVFLMPMLATRVWQAIPDGSVQTGLMLYMGHRMMKGMRDSLKKANEDNDKLKEALVEAQPTTVASPAKKAVETSHYSHYTDIIKSLGKIEQEKVQLAAEHIGYQTHPLNKLAASLFLLYKVESLIPNLANLYMTCSSTENTSLKPRIQRNLMDFKAIRGKLKTDVSTLSHLIEPDQMKGFGHKLFASLTSQFRNVRISQNKSAMFNAAEKNKLQVVHLFEFKTRRGYVALYVHANKLAYSIERSSEFTPTTLIESSITAMFSDLKAHLAELNYVDPSFVARNDRVL